jgi:ribosome-associated protein
MASAPAAGRRMGSGMMANEGRRAARPRPADVASSIVEVSRDDVRLEFLRSSGPGGQNVNKVATAVRLTFDVRRSRALPEDAKVRLLRIAGRRATPAGEIVLVARRFRTQGANRKDALDRLAALIRRAMVKPKRRRPTRPTAASKERRLEEKRRTSVKKRERRAPHDDA